MWPKKLLQLNHSAYTVPYLISSVSAAADVKLYVSVNLNTADLDMLIVKFFDSVIMSLKIFWQIVRKKKKKCWAAHNQPTASVWNVITVPQLKYFTHFKIMLQDASATTIILLCYLFCLFNFPPRQLALTLAWATGPPSGCDEKGYWGTLQDLQYKTNLMRCEGTFLCKCCQPVCTMY